MRITPKEQKCHELIPSFAYRMGMDDEQLAQTLHVTVSEIKSYCNDGPDSVSDKAREKIYHNFVALGNDLEDRKGGR